MRIPLPLNTLAIAITAMSLSTGAHALPLTLNTSWLDANGVISLSIAAQQSLQLTGIQVNAAGQASNLGLGQFNLPITQLTADVGFFSLTPVAGKVDGSVLTFDNGQSGKRVSVTGLQIDFNNKSIMADIIAGGNSTHTTLFTFDVTSPLQFSLTGGVSLTERLGNLRMSAQAATSFADGIGLPAYLSTVLTSIDFGTVDATIRPWFRTPVTGVPEPRTWHLMVLGLFGLVTWHRRLAQARGHI